MTKNPSPLQSIRAKCIACCCGYLSEIKACASLECPLWRFRLGLHPFTRKNAENPFLDPKNFKGLENLSATETLKKIGDMQKWKAGKAERSVSSTMTAKK